MVWQNHGAVCGKDETERSSSGSLFFVVPWDRGHGRSGGGPPAAAAEGGSRRPGVPFFSTALDTPGEEKAKASQFGDEQESRVWVWFGRWGRSCLCVASRGEKQVWFFFRSERRGTVWDRCEGRRLNGRGGAVGRKRGASASRRHGERRIERPFQRPGRRRECVCVGGFCLVVAEDGWAEGRRKRRSACARARAPRFFARASRSCVFFFSQGVKTGAASKRVWRAPASDQAWRGHWGVVGGVVSGEGEEEGNCKRWVEGALSRRERERGFGVRGRRAATHSQRARLWRAHSLGCGRV